MSIHGAKRLGARLLICLVLTPQVLAPQGARATSGEAPSSRCDEPATAIHTIQGTSRSSPLLGEQGVVVDAVVVGTYPGFPDGLGGFFVQEEDIDQDADLATSEGLFVFDGGLGAGLAVGDRVRVQGRVSEFFGMTELSHVREIVVCPRRGKVRAAWIELPVANVEHWEQWEGMRVRIRQELVATEHRNLGRFGEVEVAAGGRLWQPTHREAPGAQALALEAQDARRRVLIDDGSDAIRPVPTPYLERSDGATLRLGDTLNSLEGVVGYSYGRFRIHPSRPVRFEPGGQPRAQHPPSVDGTLRLVAWNVGNYFNGDGRGGGFPTRGARSAFELERQRAKLVATLVELDPDIAALAELENDPFGPQSALGELVRELNRHTRGAPYAIVEVGESDLGSPAIAVGLLYRPAAVVPLGAPAVLDGRAHSDFDDARNRPSLAQTFEAVATGERLTVVANHFKSKGSNCDRAGDVDLGDGQGNCNLTRTRAARALVEWLAEGPTEAPDAPVLVLGDLNAYPQEDPVRMIEAGGYVDLLKWFAGPDAYTFVFDGGAGRLDHALAGLALLPFVGGAGVWHTNADEPRVLDYASDNPEERYTPDPFRASDHDPVLVGLFPDRDRDGRTDARDACPATVLAETVLVGGCDSGVPETLDADGCSLSDRLIALRKHVRRGGRGDWRKRYRKRSLVHWLAGRIEAGVLTRRHRGRILACAARSSAKRPKSRLLRDSYSPRSSSGGGERSWSSSSDSLSLVDLTSASTRWQ